jgi:hypothetical protein
MNRITEKDRAWESRWSSSREDDSVKTEVMMVIDVVVSVIFAACQSRKLSIVCARLAHTHAPCHCSASHPLHLYLVEPYAIGSAGPLRPCWYQWQWLHGRARDSDLRARAWVSRYGNFKKTVVQTRGSRVTVSLNEVTVSPCVQFITRYVTGNNLELSHPFFWELAPIIST